MIRFFRLTFFLLFLGGLASAQTYSDIALQNSAGNYARVVPFAPVTICQASDTGVPCTNKVTTYTDQTLGTACTLNSPSTNFAPTSGTNCNNPGVADINGNYTAFLPSGTYRVCVYAENYVCGLKATAGAASGGTVQGTANQITATTVGTTTTVALANPTIFPGGATFNGAVSINSGIGAVGLIPDPLCAFSFGLGSQDQLCNLNGQLVWNFGGVSGTNYLLPWMKYYDLIGSPPANGSVIFFNSVTGQFELLSGNTSGTKAIVEDASGNISFGTTGTTVTLQTNGVNNTSQTTLNVINSTANSVGLTLTCANPSGGNDQCEIGGTSYTGNAATATALATTPSQCGSSLFATGIAANGNANCGSPNSALGTGEFSLAQVCPSTDTHCFQSFVDTQQANDCAWTSGTNTVTCATSHFVATDCVGGTGCTGTGTSKRIFGFNTCATNQSSYSNTLGAGAAGAVTISSFTSGTSITVSVNATGTVASNGCVIWGHPDDTAVSSLETAANAAPTCPLVHFPAGHQMWTTPHFTALNAACQFNGTVQGASYIEYGYTLQGQSPGTSIIHWTPDFNFTACPSGTSNQACLMPGPGMHLVNFSLDGGGLYAINGNPARNIVFANNGGYGFIDNFYCTNIGGNQSGMVGLRTNNTTYLQNSVFDGCGAAAAIIAGAGVSSFNSAFEDGSSTIAIVQNSGNFRSNGFTFIMGGPFSPTNQSLLQNSSGSVILSSGDAMLPNGAANKIFGYSDTGSNCKLTANGAFFAMSGGASTSVGAQFNCTNGRSNLLNSTFSGGGASGVDINVLLGTVYDEGGNLLNGTGTHYSIATGANLQTPGRNRIIGTGSGVCTSSSTLGLYGTGPNVTATTCTSATIGSGIVMQGSGTLMGLIVHTAAAGVNASSGVFTVLKNGATQTMTCTIGTSTFCSDTTHTLSYVGGDLISLQFTTQASETLAGPQATVIY